MGQEERDNVVPFAPKDEAEPIENIELVDTHTHLNDDKFADDVPDAVARARAAGVRRCINMGDTLASSKKAVELAHAYEGLFAGVGIHPEEARELTADDDAQLAKWAEDEKVVCIGEIGLDYYWVKDEPTRELQRRIFIHQLDLARQLHLPVCIHDRDAHADTLAILKKEGQGIPTVLHCYSGSVEMALELCRRGWYIGVDGPVTFKNAKRNVRVVQAVPLEQLLLETDAPYMAPEPVRGTRNEPANIPYIARKVADIKGISVEEIARVTTANAMNLYDLDRHQV